MAAPAVKPLLSASALKIERLLNLPATRYLHLMNSGSNPSLRDLYPDLTESELEVARSQLEHYLVVVLQILERVHRDPQGHPLTPGTGTLACTSSLQIATP